MVNRFSRRTGLLALFYFASGLAVLPAVAQSSQPSDTAPPLDATPQPEATPQPAAATDDTEQARLAFDDGLRLLRAEQWPDAEASFRRSLAHVPRASAKYNLAFVLYKQDKLRQSSELLQELLSSDDPALDSRYRDYAKVLLANVMAAVSVLHLVVQPETAEVRVDGHLVAISGKERSLPVDPGMHHVLVSAPGFNALASEVVTPAHSETRREMELTPLPAPAAGSALAPAQTTSQSAKRDDEPSRPLWLSAGPWVLMGVGGALLISSAVTGVLASKADRDFTKKCPTLEHCDPKLRATADKAEHLGAITNVLVISGAALAVGGVSWQLLLPSPVAQGKPRTAMLYATLHF
jgi:hypothetical protein